MDLCEPLYLASNHITLSQTIPCSMCLQYKSFENAVGKGEIACNKQFLFYLLHFLSFWRTFHHVHQILNFQII